jgi:hypothetical protein
MPFIFVGVQLLCLGIPEVAVHGLVTGHVGRNFVLIHSDCVLTNIITGLLF